MEPKDMNSSKYDLGIAGERDKLDGLTADDVYIDELMNYEVSFEGIEEGLEDDD